MSLFSRLDAAPAPPLAPQALVPASSRARLPPGLRASWIVSLGLIALVLLRIQYLPEPSDDAGVRWSELALTDWQSLLPGGASARPPRAAQLLGSVSLPHSWQSHGGPPAGVATYHLVSSLSEAAASQAAQQPWSLRIDAVSAAHRIWLNGHLLHSNLPRPQWAALPAPLLLEIPTGLLHAGANDWELEVHCAAQGGLGRPFLAPLARLEPSFLWHEALTRDLLVSLNIVCMTFSLFVLMLWGVRRQEAADGLYGLLIGVAALRNCRYFVSVDLDLSANVDSWLYFTAHVMTACIQGWFVMSLTRPAWPWFNRLLWLVLLGYPLSAALACHWDPGLVHLRTALQGTLIALLLPSLWLVARSSRTVRARDLAGLGLGWMIVLSASIHDYVVGRWVGSVTFTNWMPWAIPMALPAFSVMVLDRIMAAFRDIEQVNQRLEIKVVERTRELESAQAATQQFLASASHDLRQPVATIGLITDLLQSRIQDPKLKDLTDRLARAVHSMESLLRGLLDLSRLDSGTVEVQRRAVALQPLLESIADHAAAAAAHKGLRLRFRPTTAVVWTDVILLEQIIRNLVANAITHTQGGGVLVAARRRGARWVLQVWDTGPGIGAGDQARIFEAFVQLHNPARARAQGLGLGLAIVQRAAALLNHLVNLHSVPGRGSVFSVTLPAATSVGLPPTRPMAAPLVEGHPLRDHQVLLVEDDPALNDALTQRLRAWGAQVSAGADMKWALDLPTQNWDIIICDHRLGDGSGRELIQHLRQRCGPVPAILITGDTLPQQLADLVGSGLRVLHKPFRSETLQEALLEELNRPRP